MLLIPGIAGLHQTSSVKDLLNLSHCYNHIVHLQNKHHPVTPSGKTLNLVHKPYIAANPWLFFLIVMHSFPGGFLSER
jgi:hypothetical protein